MADGGAADFASAPSRCSCVTLPTIAWGWLCVSLRFVFHRRQGALSVSELASENHGNPAKGMEQGAFEPNQPTLHGVVFQKNGAPHPSAQ